MHLKCTAPLCSVNYETLLAIVLVIQLLIQSLTWKCILSWIVVQLYLNQSHSHSPSKRSHNHHVKLAQFEETSIDLSFNSMTVENDLNH